MSDFITPCTELSVFQSVQSSSLGPPGLVHVEYIDTPVPAAERNTSLHPEIKYGTIYSACRQCVLVNLIFYVGDTMRIYIAY